MQKQFNDKNYSRADYFDAARCVGSNDADTDLSVLKNNLNKTGRVAYFIDKNTLVVPFAFPENFEICAADHYPPAWGVDEIKIKKEGEKIIARAYLSPGSIIFTRCVKTFHIKIFNFLTAAGVATLNCFEIEYSTWKFPRVLAPTLMFPLNYKTEIDNIFPLKDVEKADKILSKLENE